MLIEGVDGNWIHASASAKRRYVTGPPVHPGLVVPVQGEEYGSDVRYRSSMGHHMTDGRMSSQTDSRAACWGDVFQQWVVTPTPGHSSSLDEEPHGEATCSINPRHDWRGGSEIPAPV